MTLKYIFREHKRKTYDSIVNFGIWQAIVLLAVGFLGGIFSAIAAIVDLTFVHSPFFLLFLGEH